MPTRHARPFAAGLAALLLALPAHAASKKSPCPAGQTMHKGKCVTACATEARFHDPSSCECPTGLVKILGGDGLGECQPARCPTNAPFAEGKACACPTGFEKKPTKKKGKVRCEAVTAAAR